MAETHRQEKTPQACSLPPASPDQARAPPPPPPTGRKCPPNTRRYFPGQCPEAVESTPQGNIDSWWCSVQCAWV